MPYGGKSGGWKGRGRLERGAIASMAKVVYVCDCGTWNDPQWDAIKEKNLPPRECVSCHRMTFTYFQSRGEAAEWASLLLLQRQGIISELERQVRIPLLTIHHDTGKPVEWAVFVADFRWKDADGNRIVAEYKPKSGMSYDAELKIRCCEAQGIPVRIITK